MSNAAESHALALYAVHRHPRSPANRFHF